MSGRINNRTLTIVFLVLAVLFVLTRIFPGGKAEKSLVTDLADMDTSRVTSVLLYPSSEEGGEIRFTRQKGGWMVEKEGILSAADDRSVRLMLGELRDLESEQLVSRSRGNWSDYGVTDSLGTRVVVRQDEDAVLDLVVGRFSYRPPPQNSRNPYGQNQVSGNTYVRISGEEEVHSVEGFLAMSLNQPFDRWRDQTVTRFNTSGISRMIFDYPADSGFIAERSENGWMAAGRMADSASVTGYLSTASRKTHREFYDQDPPSGEADYRVTFEGDNMTPLVVKAFARTDTSFLVNSSLNPGSWFRVSGGTLFTDLYPPLDKLLTPEP